MATLPRVPKALVRSHHATLPILPPNATEGQRWRLRRNLVIAIAARAGIPQRHIADVFDLPRSRIAAIVAEIASLGPISRDEYA